MQKTIDTPSLYAIIILQSPTLFNIVERVLRERSVDDLSLSAIAHDPPPLISYIAHAALATSWPGRGDEPYLRPEIGFTPRWFSEALGGINFGERWHTDPAYRAATIVAMARETRRRFGSAAQVGALQDPDNPTDLMAGAYGALMVPDARIHEILDLCTRISESSDS